MAPRRRPCAVVPGHADAPLDERAAAEMLAPYVAEVLDNFLSAGLAALEGIRVEVTEEAGDGGRHFAACRTDGRLILLSPQLVHMPLDTVCGILAHEFGHAADYSYPARWARSRSNAVLIAAGEGKNDGVPARLVSAWQERDDDEIERMADLIGETVLGVRIGYAGPCLLQTIGHGVRPRPRGLR